MSGVGGPLAGERELGDAQRGEDHALFGVFAVSLSAIIEGERVAIARRCGAIVAACQREAGREGLLPLTTVETRLAALADDVRIGLHGGMVP